MPSVLAKNVAGSLCLLASVSAQVVQTGNSATACVRPGDPSCQPQIDCDAGFYCLPNEDPVECPAGAFCPAGTFRPITCPRGHFCPSRSITPTACPVSTFNRLERQSQISDCMPCEPGYFCSMAGQIIPRVCEAGFYSGVGAEECTICPAGHVCSKSEVVECAPGELCVPGSVVAEPCPSGYYCPKGTFRPVTCPRGHRCVSGFLDRCVPGTYQRLPRQSDCVECEAGWMCPDGGMDTPIACTTPSMCPAGTISEITTSTGMTESTTTDSSVTTTIKSCRPGFAYNDAKARCIACQGGFYEFEGSCLECPAGTFNVMNAGIECYPCMAGQFCPGASNIGTDCPKDHFCPEGSTEPTRCPKNMMTENVNMSEESDCMPVSDPEPEEPEIEECEDGFYFCSKCMMCMPEKHDEPEMDKCDKGFHFCEKCQKCMPDQDDKPKCPPGLEFCDKCQMCMTIGHHDHTGGFMIPFRGGSCPSGFGLGPRRQMCLACQAGMFSGNGLVCEYCPEGTFGDMIGADHCHVCPIGHMCPNIGMSEPEKCEAGTAAEELGMEFCSLCKGGKISNKDGSACVDCADGYFAASTAEMGTAGKIKNMLAIFKPEMDAPNVCLPCPEGSYCQKGIRSQCPRGSFQPRPAHCKCEACPRGHFCASGSMQPQPCRKLKMQAKQLSQQIIAGVRGKHYVSDSVPVECRMGKNLPKHMLVKPDDSHRWG